MRFVAVGDCVCDTYLDEGVFYPGGQAINAAVNAKRSGADTSAYLGIFGDDYAAEHVRQTLIREGVETDRCRKAYAATPQPGVRIIDGDRVFFRGKRDSVAHLLRMNIAQEDLDYLSSFDACHTTNEADIDVELERIHKVVPLSYDFSVGHNPERLQAICPNVDIAFFSDAHMSDAEIDQVMKDACSQGAKIAVVTMGKRGSVAFDGTTTYMQEIVPCDAIDAMGAGDSYQAAFVVRYFDTHSVGEAMRFAAERAAQTCTLHGAFGYPCPVKQ